MLPGGDRAGQSQSYEDYHPQAHKKAKICESACMNNAPVFVKATGSGIDQI
jgi:hypothetical protein